MARRREVAGVGMVALLAPRLRNAAAEISRHGGRELPRLLPERSRSLLANADPLEVRTMHVLRRMRPFATSSRRMPLGENLHTSPARLACDVQIVEVHRVVGRVKRDHCHKDEPHITSNLPHPFMGI